MIRSMTGYGKAEAFLGSGKLTIEIRTLNGKNADVNIKTSLIPKDKEIALRKRLAKEFKRGTIDFYASRETGAEGASGRLNGPLLKAYYSQLCSIRDELGGNKPSVTTGDELPSVSDELLAAMLRLPDVCDGKHNDVVDEEGWPAVEDALERAIAAVNEFRDKEGAALYKDVTGRIARILELEDEVEGLEQERMDSVRTRVSKNLAELKLQVDPARFEQEMVFYLEKLDINEEKVRLRQHCRYFMDTIDSEDCPGRKLGFIIQEMGREINTTGSKANHAGIQRFVVRMKDELEKIREQCMNIL